MTMTTKLIITGLAALALCNGAIAADGAKLYAEKTCNACHGPAGNKPILPDYPKIAGQNAKYAERQMLDIKSGARKNGNAAAMAGVMHLVTEDDIKALSVYISKLKP
jgi:cytochrome c